MFLRRLFDRGERKRLVRTLDSDVLKEMQKTGFQPFIMVRMSEGPARCSYLVCPTQNEAPQFVHALIASGLTAQHPVLFAVDKALRLEADVAAAALSSWITGRDSHYRLGVLRGVSAFDRTWSIFYVGYPVVDIDFLYKVRSSPDVKFDAMREFLAGYLETPGNDSLRAAIAEAVALGMAGVARTLAREEETRTLVDRARALRQESLALEGASRALALAIEGRAVPEELSRFIGTK